MAKGRMNRALTPVLLLFAAVLFPAVSNGAEAVDAFSQNKKIGRSVNIIGYDPIWRSPEKARFTLRHFQLIRAAGFDSVRINLAPFRAMDANNNYQLSDAWLKVLDWSVRGALDNGLAVILDCHEYTAMGNDPEGNHGRFLAFWRQIAPRFRDASPDVMFELLNEPSRKLSSELWNSYLAESLAIVRQSNPTRTVIIGPANYNRHDSLDELKLPENDRNIIATIHYYLPMSFTHQGASWSPENRDKTGVEWLGTPEEQQAIVEHFARAQAWSKANNRPILLGEFGAYDKGPMDSRARYTAFVCRTAEKLDWSWSYWQFDSDFVVYDIGQDRWVEPIRDALIPR
jgi:endoglucanase